MLRLRVAFDNGGRPVADSVGAFTLVDGSASARSIAPSVTVAVAGPTWLGAT